MLAYCATQYTVNSFITPIEIRITYHLGGGGYKYKVSHEQQI
jgi:hypothetical protein